MGEIGKKIRTRKRAELYFLILAMFLNPKIDGIIGELELRCLPKHAIVLNPARGPLIQEEPLIQALQQGWIAGAALDTHYTYPRSSDHPLWAMDNVLLAPHISGSIQSQHFVRRTWDIFLENVERFSNSEPLLNRLSHQQLRKLDR